MKIANVEPLFASRKSSRAQGVRHGDVFNNLLDQVLLNWSFDENISILRNVSVASARLKSP